MNFVTRCILVCLFCFCYTGILYATTPFDDFSENRIDSSKWHRDGNGLERVREVTGGKLMTKIGGPVGDPGWCANQLPFANPNNINTIEAKVSITEASIAGDNMHFLAAQISGQFYEEVGGHNVWVNISLEYNGTAYEAVYGIDTSLGFRGGKFALAIQPGTEYTLKVDYNPTTQEFIFSANTESHSVTGEDRNGLSVNGSKGLTTAIIGNPNGGSGYLSATFDDVYVNNAPYEDFSVSPLSSTKWSSGEIVREIRDGQLQMNAQRLETAGETNLFFMQPAQVTDYFQADVTINSDTVLTGDNTRGEIRLDGFYYNYKYDGSGYDGVDGEIFVTVRVRLYSDGRLRPYARIDRIEDKFWNVATNLFQQDFSCAVQLDTPVTLAIEKKGLTFVFSCDQDQFSYELTGPLYDSRDNFRQLRSSVLHGSAPGDYGYVKGTVDNVYIKKSSSWTLFNSAIQTATQQ